jgi:uncharacterized protein YbjT (DUF2867 family)
MQKILVIGSTGMLGKPVTRELVQKNFQITLLARDVGNAEKLFPSVRFLKGDVFDLESLENAMRGQDAVYISLSIAQSSLQQDKQPEREGIENILSLAANCGIKRISYLSSLIHFYNGMNGFHWWAFDIKSAAVDKIKATGIPFTIFYPSTFMETFPYQMMQGNRIVLVGKSIAPMWFIAAEDYARQVSNSFLFADSANYEYVVQGPDSYTYDQAAEIFIRNLPNKKLKVFKVPIGIIKFIGSFVPKVSYGARICDALNLYPEKFESEKTWKELGKPTITLAEFARKIHI